jgi:hypothetical protein
MSRDIFGYVVHVPQCPQKAFPHTDAAKRVTEEYQLHRLADLYGSQRKWIAVALADGRSDHVLYDTKREAVRHQHHNEQWYAYIRIGPQNMTACDAEIFLRMMRTLYDKGLRLTDPDAVTGGRDIIKRNTMEDMRANARGISTNLYLPWE